MKVGFEDIMMGLMLILIIIAGGKIILQEQYESIENYCIENPNGSLNWDIQLECSDFLEQLEEEKKELK